jgi:ferredoxin--NADP+ reductase
MGITRHKAPFAIRSAQEVIALTRTRDTRSALDADGAQVPGVYCAGWSKRGPTGIIGTNKKDATETVELLLEDVRSGALPPNEGAVEGGVAGLLAERGVEAVTYAGWEAIDAVERDRGAPSGRPRIKLTTWDELLAASRGAQAPSMGS